MTITRPMTLSRWPAAGVWGGFAAAVLLVGTTMLARLTGVLPDDQDLPAFALAVYTLIVATVAGVGAVLATRVPANRIGWWLWIAGCAIAVALTGEVYPPLAGDDAGVIGVVTGTLAVIADPAIQLGLILLVVAIPLNFPTGRPVGPRWALANWGTAGLIVATSLLQASPGGPPVPAAAAGVADALWRAVGIVQAIGWMLIPVGIVSLVIRYRGAGAIERRQIRWFAAAAIWLLFLMSLALLPLGPISDVAWIAATFSLPLVPIAIGVAILRYRLYAIDRIVSRTIGWALVSGILVLVFAGTVVGLQAVLAPLTNNNTLAVAASTLVAAALFAPVRQRVQRGVDRRFHRSRYDGERLLALFGERLRDEVDLAAIDLEVRGTITAAVRPDGTAVWLRPSR